MSVWTNETAVSIVDGNIDASQNTTDQAKDLVCSLNDLATIEIFNCDGGDGPPTKQRSSLIAFWNSRRKPAILLRSHRGAQLGTRNHTEGCADTLQQRC